MAALHAHRLGCQGKSSICEQPVIRPSRLVPGPTRTRRAAVVTPFFGGTHRVVARSAAQAAQRTQELSLHVGETTISFPFSWEQAQQLDTAIAGLLQTFAEKAKATRPRRWESMEVTFSDAATGVQRLELFCNPNAYSTAFDAKLLLTLQGGPVQVTTEGRLSAIKSDLDAFLATTP